MKYLFKVIAIFAFTISSNGQIISGVIRNSAVNTAIAEDPAASLEAIGAASSALQKPIESNASAVLFHDNCTGAAQTLAVSGTRTVEPGPGTMTVGDSLTNGIRRYENGSLYLSPLPEGSGTQVSMICGGSRTAAAGLTIMARVIPGFGKTIASTFVGFSAISTGSDMKRGAVAFTYGSSPYELGDLLISQLDSLTDSGGLGVGSGVISPGEEVAFAVHYDTLTHQSYWMQGGRAREFGCTVGGETWFKLGDTYQDMTGQTVYPLVSAQWGGVHEFRDIQVLSSWNPSPRNTLFDYSRTQIGIHIPSFGRDPSTNLAVMAWNKGTTHVNADTEIRGSVKLSSGWTAPATLLAAPGGGANIHVESVSAVNGALWLVYNKNATAADGGTLCRRVLTVAENGTVTVGSETVLSGISGTHNLGLSPIITLPSGRLMMSYAPETGSIIPWVAYSDNNGSTWTEAVIAGSLPADAGLSFLGEPCVVLESDGAVGLYARSNGASGRSTYYSRCALPNAATLSWSTPREIPEIPQPSSTQGMRVHAIRHSSGRILLAGSDNKTNRRNLTIWELGDNAAVYGKAQIGDWGASNETTSTTQYPTLMEDGDDLLIAFSQGVHASGSEMRVMSRRWTAPIAIEAGGTGTRGLAREFSRREKPKVSVWLQYGATPTPDMSLGKHFNITLTGTGNTLQAPSNPFPWDEVTVVFVQGSGGSKSILFHADYQFNGITPSWRTSANESNILRAQFNPITRKWIVIAWN